MGRERHCESKESFHEHNRMSPARAQIQTTQSEVKGTNDEASTTPTKNTEVFYLGL